MHSISGLQWTIHNKRGWEFHELTSGKCYKEEPSPKNKVHFLLTFPPKNRQPLNPISGKWCKSTIPGPKTTTNVTNRVFCEITPEETFKQWCCGSVDTQDLRSLAHLGVGFVFLPAIGRAGRPTRRCHTAAADVERQVFFVKPAPRITP